MDSAEEDVSTRVLLRNVLHTEVPRSPVTRSVLRQQQQQAASSVRQSLRSRPSVGYGSPQVALRRKLKERLHESATQSPHPPSKRRSLSSRATKTPAAATPSLFDDDITPRGLLRGIIQTEAEASLLLAEQPRVREAEPAPVEPSLHRHSEGGSGLDLPDLATENLTRAVKTLSRRRPAPNFNVTDFENQLEQSDQTGETDATRDLSTDSQSALSLTLKTPFVDMRSEKAGLLRKAANRRLRCVDEFDEAVQNRLERGQDAGLTIVQDGQTLGDTDWQKFTLGLTDVTVPDLTTDIVMSETAPHAPSASMASPPREEGLASVGDDGDCKEESLHEAENEGGEDNGANQEKTQEDKELTNVQEVDPEPLVTEPEEQESGPKKQEESESPAQEGEGSHDISQSVSQVLEEAPEPHEEEEPPGKETTVEDIQEEDFQEEELAPQTPERITRRAYHSVGVADLPGVTAGGRTYKSLGPGLHSIEQDLVTPKQSMMELPSEEEALEKTPSPEGKAPSVMTTPPPTQMELSDGQVHQSHTEDLLTSEPHSPTAEEENEDEGNCSEELSMKTPAFIRERREMRSPTVLTTPTVLKEVNNPTPQVVKPRSKQKRKAASAPKGPALSKSYIMTVFKHFAKTKVASDIYPVINEMMQKYFDRLADDLEAYASHAKRRTIEVEDVELLMRRQGFVKDRSEVTMLIEKLLPLEYRKLLIPVATSGNKVIPKQKR